MRSASEQAFKPESSLGYCPMLVIVLVIADDMLLILLAQELLAEPDQHGDVAVFGSLELHAPQARLASPRAQLPQLHRFFMLMQKAIERRLIHPEDRRGLVLGALDLGEVLDLAQRLLISHQLRRPSALCLFGRALFPR